MAASNNDILTQAESYLSVFFKENIGAEYVFHDFQHTKNVVEAVADLGKDAGLSDREIELLQLAAWFHDSGYDKGAAKHEERSVRYAHDFLSRFNLPQEEFKLIERCILATKIPSHPKDIFEKTLCDADLSHLGKKSYWDRCGRIRQELLLTQSNIMSEQEWVDFELCFMNNHRYFTSVAEQLYNPGKLKHIRQLKKQQMRLSPSEVGSVDDLARKDKLKKKKIKKQVISPKNTDLDFNLGRGVETMYRTAYRTHISLSAIADNKANIMLSINAIVISIALPQLLTKFEMQPQLIVPTILLLLVCIVSIVLATLSTRPKITKGYFTREDIASRKANLLFFGNFYRMKLDDFHWGMMEMIKDKDFLYSSMTKDIYFLGVVLAKKFRYLSYCYSVFMYGMIATVLAFAISFLF
jgi:predicted metal-dependent HD superfamily phosphohydrolase